MPRKKRQCFTQRSKSRRKARDRKAGEKETAKIVRSCVDLSLIAPRPIQIARPLDQENLLTPINTSEEKNRAPTVKSHFIVPGGDSSVTVSILSSYSNTNNESDIETLHTSSSDNHVSLHLEDSNALEKLSMEESEYSIPHFDNIDLALECEEENLTLAQKKAQTNKFSCEETDDLLNNLLTQYTADAASSQIYSRTIPPMPALESSQIYSQTLSPMPTLEDSQIYSQTLSPIPALEDSQIYSQTLSPMPALEVSDPVRPGGQGRATRASLRRRK